MSFTQGNGVSLYSVGRVP